MPMSQEREGKTSSQREETQGESKTGRSSVREDSKKWLDYATHKAKIAFGQKKERFVEELGGVADMMREGAAHLEQSDLASAHYMENGAEQVERWRHSLQKREPEDFLTELTAVARQNPGTFLLGTALAGFSLVRLFRSVDYNTVEVLDTEDAVPPSDDRSPAEAPTGSP